MANRQTTPDTTASTPAEAPAPANTPAAVPTVNTFRGFRGFVSFSPPSAPKPGAKPSKTPIAAYVELFGAFGDLPLMASGFALGKGERDYRVFFPSGGGGYYQHIGPASVPIDPSVTVLDRRTGERITMQPDAAGMAAQAALSAAIVGAWIHGANVVPGVTSWGVRIPIEVPASEL